MADEEMLPPPRKQQLSTNADFRKLLETPRIDRFAEKPRAPRPKKAAQHGQTPKPRKKPQRSKPEEEEGDDDGPSYRLPVSACTLLRLAELENMITVLVYRAAHAIVASGAQGPCRGATQGSESRL